MKMQNVLRRYGAPMAVVGTALAPLSAFAQSSGYGGILSGLSTGDAESAVIAAAAIIAGLGFAIWAGKKVARFFG